MEEGGKHICMADKLVDKFADNGIVTVVAGEITGSTVDIKLWLMSCRVLKRGMEDLMMNEFVARCKDKNIEKIVAHYYPTAKNAMVKDFYGDYGFTLESEDAEGNRTYSINVADYEQKPVQINL
jgi:FkbH-like protein